MTLAPIPILDKYAHGVINRPARQPWLATISAGSRDPNGYPRASRPGDAQLIHIAPGEDVPGLTAALEAGNWRELTVALPSNQHEDFLSQRFVRYSATRVEAFGDAEAIHVLSSRKVQKGKSTVDEALPRQTFRHGTPEYDREVDQCAVAGSLLFVLARWQGPTPEIYFPDQTLGLYRLRFTSRTSLERLVGGIEQLRALTGGSVAGIPLRLSLQFGEVADAGGVKRTVPYWALRFAPPPDAGMLTASSWSGFKAAAFAEVDTLRALPPGAAAAVTVEVVEAEGPDVDLDNPPVDAETTRATAARYDAIYGQEDVIEVSGHTVVRATGEVIADPAETEKADYYEALKRAVDAGAVEARDWALRRGATRADIADLRQQLRAAVNAHTIAQAQRPTTAAQSEPGGSEAPPAPRRAEMWAERRELEVKALELGIRVPTLNTRCADEELAEANDALRASITAVEDDLAAEAPDDAQQALV